MTKATETTAITISETGSTLANDYFGKNVVGDFAQVPSHLKLTLLQNTPRRFIKTRTVGGSNIPYIEHEYAEKCLNFVFNFNVSCEVMSKEFRETTIATSKGSKKAWEAEAEVKFTFKTPDGYTIVRTVYSSHRGFESPATTRGDAMKSAISKAWTVVARTFGIGSNLVEMEKKAYATAENREETPSPAPSTQPVRRAWDNPAA